MNGALLSLRQLVAALKAEDPKSTMTVKTLRRYCKEGMQYFPDSGKWYTKREWYESFIRAKTVNAPKDEEQPAEAGLA